MGDAPIEPDVRAPRRPASPQARRRRRRRFGTLVFVVIAIGLVIAAVGTLSGSDGGHPATAPTSVTRVAATTTTVRPPAGPFSLTDGVNVRAGPGTKYPVVGTLTVGTKVMVTCVITGETIQGPKGPTAQWVRITGTTPVGYITNEYVATGAAVDDRSTIPLCPGI